jgi:hypothetical protein
MTTIKRFATSMRANSLRDVLAAQNIHARIVTLPWINKKLPPPKIEVRVDDDRATDALKVAAENGF